MTALVDHPTLSLFSLSVDQSFLSLFTSRLGPGAKDGFSTNGPSPSFTSYPSSQRVSQTNITNTISIDTFSLSFSSLDPLATPPLQPSTTLGHSFAPPRWPWSYAKLSPSPPSPPSSPAPFLLLTTAQFDALKAGLVTPPCTSLSSPMGFSFSDLQNESTMEEHEGLRKCYDEWMENKLAVLEELREKAELLKKVKGFLFYFVLWGFLLLMF